MDMEVFEQGDRSDEHLEAFRSEQAAEREEQRIGTAAGN
jgi:hypothetical protein